MRAFIIRPFGIKEGIDFDRVERELIDPALDALGITGRSTGEIVQQGNIRADMFSRLLAADLVVADVSIHNANVFYELGIRHALRDRRSFLLKSQGDSVPFDLQTDRYFYYDAAVPGARLADMVKALEATLNSLERDSPVFQLLPALRPANPATVNLPPFDFLEDVERAAQQHRPGVLQLLADEAGRFDWGGQGLRAVGKAQFNLGDHSGARATWESVQALWPLDVEANTTLSTLYDRLGDMDRADQVLQRVLAQVELACFDRAQVRSLLGRNAKSRWQRDWADHDDLQTRRTAALASPHLEDSLEGYIQGYREDLNHIFSGLNALTQVILLVELARAQPSIWAERFEERREADRQLRRLRRLRRELEVNVRLTLDSELTRLARQDRQPGWAGIGQARLAHLTSRKPKRVAYLYRRALAGASDYELISSRDQLRIFLDLDVLSANSRAALEAIDALLSPHREAPPTRVVLGVGHRIDPPDRRPPRFPADRQEQARALLRKALEREQQQAKAEGGGITGVAGGTCGADILFHEVCLELGIPSRLYLPLSSLDYAASAVQDAGPEWMERYRRLCIKPGHEVLSESGQLPRWLRSLDGYDPSRRALSWLLYCACALADNRTLLALWDGEQGHTHDLVQAGVQRGFKLVQLDCRRLLEQAPRGERAAAL